MTKIHHELTRALLDGIPNPPTVKEGVVIPGLGSYCSFEDIIRIQPIGCFAGHREYCATFFHELIHATGHTFRLNRKSLKRKPRSDDYGSRNYITEELGPKILCDERLQWTASKITAYSVEEIIAEIGAMTLGMYFNVHSITIEAAQITYIAHYRQTLGDLDKPVMELARKKAKEAVDFILQYQSQLKI